MENIWLTEEKKKVMEKEGNFVKEKYILYRRRRKTEKEKEESFGEGKLIVTPTDQPILAQNQLIRCVPYLCVGRFLTLASFCTSVDGESGAVYVNRKSWVHRLKNTV